MSLYQRKRLTDMSDIGEPGPLPDELKGALTDEDLARIGDIVPPERQEEYAGQGFFPVAPPPPPAPRWIHKAIFKRRFTAAERMAIRAAEASDPILRDFSDLVDSTDEVFLDDPDMTAGLGYLVAQGLLASGRPAQICE